MVKLRDMVPEEVKFQSIEPPRRGKIRCLLKPFADMQLISRQLTFRFVALLSFCLSILTTHLLNNKLKYFSIKCVVCDFICLSFVVVDKLFPL